MSSDREQALQAIAAALSEQPRLTMEQLAKAVGVSRATLARMFPKRDDLIAQLHASALERAVRTIDELCPERGAVPDVIRRFVAAVFPEADLHFFLYRIERYGGPQGADDDWAPSAQRMLQLFQRGQEEGTLRVDMPAMWMLDTMAALLFAAAEAVRAGRLARAEAPSLVCSSLLDGIGRRPALRA